MNAPSMTTTTDFAAAVRAALSDLPPDELDELTDGLEADLAERLDEAPDAAAGLGDPLAYAEELRAAAGYPPRPARGHLGATLPNLRTFPQELRRRWDLLLQRRPLVASVVAFFVALRPVWWVLRGVALYFLGITMLGLGALGAAWPLLVVAIVLSVQVGRGWMRNRTGVLWLQRAASVIAIVALPFIAGWTATQLNLGVSTSYMEMYEPEVYTPQGITRDGVGVDNIFAYDADGTPIEQVQLFDQNGQPLNLTSDSSAQWWDAQDGSMLVPSGAVPGRAGWNVFPLAHLDSWSDYEDDGAIDDSEVSDARFPAASVKPLAD